MGAVLALALTSAAGGRAWAHSFGPPPGNTGAPGQGTCARAGCHASFPLNSGPGSLTVGGLPASGYDPGKVYNLVVTLQQAGQQRWGFEASALSSPGSATAGQVAGAFAVTDAVNTQLEPSSGTSTIEHTADGTSDGTADGPVSWQFQWQAPAAGFGPVTLYVAGNAADGNGNNSGDYIYSKSFPIPEASAAPAVVPGDVNGDGKVGIADVVLLLQGVVGLTTLTPDQQKAGDLAPAGTGGAPSGDGKISIADVVRLLRFVVGLETTLS